MSEKQNQRKQKSKTHRWENYVKSKFTYNQSSESINKRSLGNNHSN